jgi:predicted metal-dependent peptidase
VAAYLPKGIHHPIHDLVANATRDWEAKVARQSKTLEEAVREYRRRHNRNPPKGFDDW